MQIIRVMEQSIQGFGVTVRRLFRPRPPNNVRRCFVVFANANNTRSYDGNHMRTRHGCWDQYVTGNTASRENSTMTAPKAIAGAATITTVDVG